tara:strand:- start:711 stop:986 length:276 start_codon:yes stop_codon:yes gene_type:complete
MGSRFDEEITSLITKNQTLLRKKGLLKRLLEDEIIRHLIEKTIQDEGGGILGDGDEKELIKLLIDNEFNLDKTIEGIIKNVASNMPNLAVF